MLKKRIVATLVSDHALVVQSIGFKKYLPIGNAVVAIEFLNTWGIDEIVFLDISARKDDRSPDFDYIKKMSVRCHVPLAVGGGGVSELADVEEAVAACRKVGNEQIALLKCTSAYPTPVKELNLKTIPDIGNRFGVVTGLSDHTMGSTAAVAACALGAKIIEKHFILDRKIGGPDASFSMEPSELKQMVDEIRFTEKALGHINYELTPKTRKSREHSRSIFIAEDIKKDDVFTDRNLRIVRPGHGLHPRFYSQVLGKKVAKPIEKGTPLDSTMYL